MRETLIKLDDVNNELKSELQLKNGKAHIDEKWLAMFDGLLVDLIKSRIVVDFATSKDDGIDWVFVKESIEKTRR